VKKILVVLILLFCLMPTASANLMDIFVPEKPKPPVSVVVFMDKHILSDGQTVTTIRNALNEKFKDAKSVVIYGDDQAKSPEFLEFAEKVKTDPANEKDIKVINIGELTKYARSINSDYVILITIAPFNMYDNFWSGIRVDMKENVSVIDVASQKYLEYLSWYKEGTNLWMDDGAKDLVNQLVANFHWTPAEPNENKSVNQEEVSNPSVVVFLSDVILEKPELVEKVRKTISEKFHASVVPINGDNKPKSSQFLDLIGKVETNSAKQQSFILKKEDLVEYGKATNSNTVIAINISNVGAGDNDFSYRLKADILVVDAESKKYLSNVVFDTIDKKKRQEGLEFILNKIQNEFQLP